MELVRTLRVGVVACIALVAFALAPAASSQTSTPPSGFSCLGIGDIGMMVGTPGMGTMMIPEQVDLIFIDMMIVHHEGAVAMARIALERGDHPEIIQLAREIVRAQEQEITQLTTWREAWYPDVPAFTLDQMMMGVEMMNGRGMMNGIDMMAVMNPGADVAEMCASSGSFDLIFIDTMIPHHQSAILMAEAAARHSANPELRKHFNASIDAQTGQLEQMEGWRDAWFGEATP